MEATRVDRWLWAVRASPTRSAATAQCRAGRVRVNGAVAKPAALVRAGDQVEVVASGRTRMLEVVQVIDARVGPAVAAGCLLDRSPPPPPKARAQPAFVRDAGAGRPTKRDRRRLDRLRNR